MEFKSKNNYENGRRGLNVPQRGHALRPAGLAGTSDAKKVEIPKDLASERERLGFGDVPVDDENMEDVRFRDILLAWVKQAIKHSPLENKLKSAASKKERLDQIKNDLKWAMQADLDEPVKPSKKPETIPPKINPVNVKNDHSPVSDPGKTIDINISFGSLPKLPQLPNVSSLKKMAAKAKIQHLQWTRGRIIIAASTLLIATAGVAWLFVPGLSRTNKEGVSSTKIGGGPEYTTLLPDGKSIASLGGWHRVSPADRAPVYAYADKVGDVAVNVSQQPVPDNFKPDVEKSIAELAKGYSATDKVSIGSTTFYVGTSMNGPQSVILAKNDTLILMKSTQKISDTTWASYVESLR